MAKTVKIAATDGSPVEFVDEIIGQGGMKDVYFSPDRRYVVAFFREKQDQNSRERLQMITGLYRERIFNQAGGEYWRDLFCWPDKMVEYEGRVGITAPTYQPHFFFKHGSVNGDMLGIRGKEKEGKWFASASLRKKQLDPQEKGDWLTHLRVCLNISRAVRRLHAAGLAHSDLSYKNVLIDPTSGKAAVIDIDGLVVPNKFAPDVIGTPDFIAPEVLATSHLPKTGLGRVLPSIQTDRHALAVMIYMYLLYRHPLRGGKIHHLESEQDERMAMGSHALFIEHPQDTSNRPKLKEVRPADLPWADVQKIPCSVAGPYLKKLFEQAFVDGLHHPGKRPTADDWEHALVKTVDLIQPCDNPTCEQKWFVFDNTTRPACPFCSTSYRRQLPVLNLYSARPGGKFQPDNHRLMVYNNQYIYPWHVNTRITPNERLTAEQKKPVAYFAFYNGRWVMVNQTITGLREAVPNQPARPIAIGTQVELHDGQQLVLDTAEGGRLVHVQMVNPA